jgi:hypothetical protein
MREKAADDLRLFLCPQFMLSSTQVRSAPHLDDCIGKSNYPILHPIEQQLAVCS